MVQKLYADEGLGSEAGKVAAAAGVPMGFQPRAITFGKKQFHMGRPILAITAGLVLSVIINMLVQSFSHYLYPLPVGAGMQNPVLLRDAMYNAPVEMYLIVLAGYILASFAGGFLAAFVSRHHQVRNALIVGLLLTAAGVASLLRLPHAPWFWLSVLVYVPFAYLGGRLGHRSMRKPLTEAEEELL